MCSCTYSVSDRLPFYRIMRDLGKNLGIPLHVFGPETHMTAIVGMALGKRPVPEHVAAPDNTTANFLLPTSVSLLQIIFNFITCVHFF
jgi:hypothetical protein